MKQVLCFMKKCVYHLFAALVLFFTVPTVKSQNLLPNGGFEDNIICPSQPGGIGLCLGWDVPANTGWTASSDLFNTCAAPPPPGSGLIVMATVPSNPCGFQAPRTGDGYAGVVVKGRCA